MPQPDWTEADGAQIAADLKARLGEQAEFALNLVDEIPEEKSGKYRYVVSHVPLPDGLN